jgi:ketosteroid isomerase-like protein
MKHSTGHLVVKNVLDLLARGELDEAMKFINDDFKCTEAASLPYAGVYRGPEGFKKLFALLSATWDEFGFIIHDVFGTDDNVAVVETIFGKVGNRPFEMPVVEHWQLRDGKVIGATPYYHDTALLQELFAERASNSTR